MSDVKRIDPVQFNGGTPDTMENILRLCVQVKEAGSAIADASNVLFSRVMTYYRECLMEVYGDSNLPPTEAQHAEAFADFEGLYEEAKAGLVKRGEYTSKTIADSTWSQYYSDIKRATELLCPFLETTEDGEWKYDSRKSVNRFRTAALKAKDEAEAKRRLEMRARRAIQKGEATSVEDYIQKQEAKAAADAPANGAAPAAEVSADAPDTSQTWDKDDMLSGLRDDTKAAIRELIHQAQRLDSTDKGHAQLMIHLDKMVNRSLAGAVRHVMKVAEQEAEADEASTTSKAA